MDTVDGAPDAATEANSLAGERPRISRSIWHPWYAKAWWIGVALYWAGKLGSWFSPGLDTFYASAAAGYLNVVFLPFTPLIVLGLGYVGAWMDHYRWKWVSEPREELAPRRSVGGYIDPLADPLDPRSPKYWHRHNHNRARH
ncbi:hypothetical protein HL653_17200 [Sphingomonas sp. AP4-R1]|uniref:hypothetical protein n=1 Tax=Sphingomonas sp. AP4-R1 TaxID=2735134 RepID=UPI001493D5DB|nr:hypothetical protein [Sphingomonas sp. AP4-R1]QJU59270.1 hypothetical protein HL653_17200 [Sphingomonas sp. AP4-R1]